MERLTINKLGSLLVKYGEGIYRSPCYVCENIYICNVEKDNVCALYRTIERLAEYEDIGLLPEQIKEVDRLYAEKCRELAELQKSSFSGIELVQIWAELEKLKEYQKLENQGKLLKLPCAVGDTVYTIYSDEDGSFIEESKVEEVSTHRIWIDSMYFDYDDIGKNVFLTQSGAKEALKDFRAN